MLKHFVIGKNKITLTCSLPLDLKTFESNNQTLAHSDVFHLERLPVGERPPLQIRYHTPKKKDGDCHIVLAFKHGEEAPLYYEDVQKLANVLNRNSPVTKDRLVDDATLAAFRSEARQKLPSLLTKFYPDAYSPQAAVAATQDGRVELHLMRDHPQFSDARGTEIIEKLNKLYLIRRADNPSYFSTRSDVNDGARLEQAAQVLAEYGILPKTEQARFVRETRTAQLRQFALGELAAMPSSPTAEDGSYANAMRTLARTGDFGSLRACELGKLHAIAQLDPLSSDADSVQAEAWLKDSLPDVRRQEESITFFSQFLPELKQFYRHDRTVEGLLNGFLEKAATYTGSIQGTLTQGKRDVAPLRDRDRHMLRLAEQALVQAAPLVNTPQEERVISLALGHHLRQMNTLEGTQELGNLVQKIFPRSEMAEAFKKEVELVIPKRTKALWKAKFGKDLSLKPEDYAPDATIPECAGPIVHYLKGGGGRFF